MLRGTTFSRVASGLLLTLVAACSGPSSPSDTPSADIDRADDASADAPVDAPEDVADALPLDRDETDEAPDDADAAGEVHTEDAEPDGTHADADVPQETDATHADASDPTDAPDVDDPNPWRSELFPVDWLLDPDANDVPSLEDYSWAGYAAGEREEGAPADAPIFDTRDYGLPVPNDDDDVDPLPDATPSIQAAIDAAEAAGGGVVWIPEGTWRLDGVVRVRGDGVVVRGAGSESTRLFFSQHQGLSNRAHITLGAAPRLGPHLPLRSDAGSRTARIVVDGDGDAWEVGDELVVGKVITDAFLEEHEMTGTWRAFNGTWQPFAWRTVVAVHADEDDPERVTLELDIPLREAAPLRDDASVRRVTWSAREVGIEGLAVSNAVAWTDAWAQTQVHAIELRGVRDAWVRDVRSWPSPLGEGPDSLPRPELQSSGVLVHTSRHVTLRDVHLANAQHRGTGGNGYLFEIRQSNEILTVDSTAREGRHNFIQNWGFGVSGCVWLRIHSEGSAQVVSPDLPLRIPAASEFHHSLATSNLLDASRIDDAFQALNRGDWSTGAGQTAWKNVFWNTSGQGALVSLQWGWGYIIGTSPDLRVRTRGSGTEARASGPEDYVEGLGRAATLEPASLYEAQLALRLGRR
jgi:hypothetical protein